MSKMSTFDQTTSLDVNVYVCRVLEYSAHLHLDNASLKYTIGCVCACVRVPCTYI